MAKSRKDDLTPMFMEEPSNEPMFEEGTTSTEPMIEEATEEETKTKKRRTEKAVSKPEKSEDSALNTEIAGLETENTGLRADIKNLKSENADLKTEIKNLKSENTRLRHRAEQIGDDRNSSERAHENDIRKAVSIFSRSNATLITVLCLVLGGFAWGVSSSIFIGAACFLAAFLIGSMILRSLIKHLCDNINLDDSDFLPGTKWKVWSAIIIVALMVGFAYLGIKGKSSGIPKDATVENLVDEYCIIRYDNHVGLGVQNGDKAKRLSDIQYDSLAFYSKSVDSLDLFIALKDSCYGILDSKGKVAVDFIFKEIQAPALIVGIDDNGDEINTVEGFRAYYSDSYVKANFPESTGDCWTYYSLEPSTLSLGKDCVSVTTRPLEFSKNE